MGRGRLRRSGLCFFGGPPNGLNRDRRATTASAAGTLLAFREQSLGNHTAGSGCGVGVVAPALKLPCQGLHAVAALGPIRGHGAGKSFQGAGKLDAIAGSIGCGGSSSDPLVAVQLLGILGSPGLGGGGAR